MRRPGAGGRGGSGVCDPDALDAAIEGEGRLVVVVKRDGSAKADADFKAVVCSEQRGALTGTRPLARISAPTRMVMSSGPAGRCSAKVVSTTIVVGPGGQFGCRADFGAGDDEQVVLVAQVSVVEVAGQAASDAAEGVEHSAGVGG